MERGEQDVIRFSLILLVGANSQNPSRTKVSLTPF